MTTPNASIGHSPLRIIALAPNDWDGEWFNRQHLLSRLARRHAIVYSNGLWFSWERNSSAFRSSPWRAQFVESDGVVLHRRGRLPFRLPRIRAWDRLVIKRTCRRLTGRLAHQPGPLVAHVFHPEFLPFVAPLKPDYVVYHAYDLFRAMIDAPATLVADENRLVERADLVVATSRETARDLQRRTARSVEVIGNGVDWRRFDTGTQPADPAELANIPHPRVGYVGTMNPKVDFRLIRDLAERRRNWQFVLVGPMKNLKAEDLSIVSSMQEHRNVHFIEKVEQRRVAEFLLNIDVGMIPYRTAMGWPAAGYPLKMHEYLACGLPVVSAELESAQEFAAAVAIAGTPKEWEDAIGQAVESGGLGTTESRRAVARANDWDARATRLEQLLQEMVSRPARRPSGGAGTPAGLR